MKINLLEEAYKYFPEAENDLQAIEQYRNIIFDIARERGKNDMKYEYYRKLYYELNDLYKELFFYYINEELGGQNDKK